MARHRNAPRGEETRQKLLHTAMQLFSMSGYHGVSTRDIAAGADANLAAIAYHFGGKQGLYSAVLDYLFNELGQVITPLVERAKAGACDVRTDSAGLEHTVRSFVEGFVAEGLHREYASWAADLLRWESRSGKEYYSKYIESLFRPMHQAGEALACSALGYGPGSTQAVVLGHSLVGICMGFVRNRDVLLQQAGWDEWTDERIRESAVCAADNVCRMLGLESEGSR